MSSLALLFVCCALPEAAPDTVVVCPAEFRTALQPWVDYREEQGHQLAFVDNLLSRDDIRASIQRVAEGGKLKYVLLVGDADPLAKINRDVRARTVPTFLVKAEVNVKWGSEPELATDNTYADLDGDRKPDVAVGRLAADSPAELSTMVKKIIDYEAKADFGLWRRRVNLVAGVGGFGKVADSVLESATKKLLIAGIPTPHTTSVTYGSWRSPYCPDPRNFQKAAIDRFNEGCLFWVYIGHGRRHGLDFVRVPGGWYPILSNREVALLDAKQHSPIAVFLACYTGALDDPRDCLAEEMLKRPGGPVAAFSGSRVTMPYAMSAMSNELLSQYFRDRCETIGELIVNTKRKMVEPLDGNTEDTKSASLRRLIDGVAEVLSPSQDLLAEERAEHLDLFNLFGDPLMRLYHPQEISVATEEKTYAGEQLFVKTAAPFAGRCTVELVCRRDRLRNSPPLRVSFDPSPENLASYDETYRQANDHRWTTSSQLVSPGQLEIPISIPDNARGSCHVRVYLEGEKSAAMGAADVYVRSKRSK